MATGTSMHSIALNFGVTQFKKNLLYTTEDVDFLEQQTGTTER